MRRGLFAFATTALLLAGTTSAAWAQDAVPEPAPAAAPEVIPVPKIPERTEALQQLLRKWTEDAQAAPAVTSIEADLPRLRAEEARLRANTETLLGAPSTIEALGDDQSAWAARLRTLTADRKTLTGRAGVIEDGLAELVAARALWTRTLEHADESAAPADVLAAVRGNLAGIAAAEKSVRARRSQLLSLLTTISRQEVEASEATETLEQARVALRSRVFEPDAAPLWVALSRETPEPEGRVLQRSLAAGWHELRDFAEKRRGAFGLLGASFVGAVALAETLRRRIRKRGPKAEAGRAMAIFERPVSVAVLITVVIAGFAVPFAPGSFWDVVGVLLLVPILRVLTPVLPEAGMPALWILAAFYLVDRARDLIAGGPTVERVLFVCEMAAAAGIALSLLRPARLLSLPRAAGLRVASR